MSLKVEVITDKVLFEELFDIFDSIEFAKLPNAPIDLGKLQSKLSL